jgi:protein-S-isoprenylcysteine O-methyltransferase Ste14
MVNFATGLIEVIWGIWAAIWLILAFRTKRTIARSGGWGRLWVAWAVLYVIASRLMVHSSLHDRVWAPSPAISIVASVLMVAGAAFTIWARFTIGANWSGMVTLKENHELIQRGPYHLARHPIYTGLLFMGIASVLQYAEPIGFIEMAIVILLFIPKIRLEEKLMTENFPDQYSQYRRQVKAIIPFIV